MIVEWKEAHSKRAHAYTVGKFRASSTPPQKKKLSGQTVTMKKSDTSSGARDQHDERGIRVSYVRLTF
jgi:hypothetical protein